MTLTTIYERAREIGTLRAMGISHAAIRRLFVYEGMLQGLFGAVAGGVLAWVATLLVNGAKIELAAQDEFDAKVVNREVGQAAADVVALMDAPLGATSSRQG